MVIEAKLKLDVDELMKTAQWDAECQIYDNEAFEALPKELQYKIFKAMEYGMRTALERVSEFNLVAK